MKLEDRKYYDFELKTYLRTLDYSDYEKNTMIKFVPDDYHVDCLIQIPSQDECKTYKECWDILEKNYPELSGQREFFRAWYINDYLGMTKEKVERYGI